MRHDGREPGEIRPLKLERRYTRAAPGSVLVTWGSTVVLVTASVENRIPPWMKKEAGGWVTAEYAMLPGSTAPRKRRDRDGKLDGRTAEIQRLVGRSLRACLDLSRLGERTITIDCDVLQADGGTRTAAITGGFVALIDALRSLRPSDPAPLAAIGTSVAAVSVGLVDGVPVADLDYHEDHTAQVDMNLVMTGAGRFVELQGTAEGAPFDERQLRAMVRLGRSALERVQSTQRRALGRDWPLKTGRGPSRQLTSTRIR